MSAGLHNFEAMNFIITNIYFLDYQFETVNFGILKNTRMCETSLGYFITVYLLLYFTMHFTVTRFAAFTTF